MDDMVWNFELLIAISCGSWNLLRAFLILQIMQLLGWGVASEMVKHS